MEWIILILWPLIGIGALMFQAKHDKWTIRVSTLIGIIILGAISGPITLLTLSIVNFMWWIQNVRWSNPVLWKFK